MASLPLITNAFTHIVIQRGSHNDDQQKLRLEIKQLLKEANQLSTYAITILFNYCTSFGTIYLFSIRMICKS
jgi:hypothetical protein